MAVKEKKSFKKYAKKHLATVIQNRRQGAKAKKEKLERIDRKKARETKEAEKEEKEHLAHLERLKDDDPDFYSYLEDEDPQLLEFGKDDMELVGEEEGSDPETESDDDSDDDGKGRSDAKEAKRLASQTNRITEVELNRCINEKNLEQCVQIFLSAVQELGYSTGREKAAKCSRKFDDPSLVKQSIMKIAKFSGTNIGHFYHGSSGFKSHKICYLFKQLLHCMTTIIGEENPDSAFSASILQSIVPFAPVFHIFRGMTKTVLKASLRLCTAAEEVVRIAAYLVVRAIATRSTGTRSMYQSAAFKGIFLAMIRSTFQYNAHNAPIVTFLMNCVTDLYGTDIEAAYQHTFVYLRQLGIYLRAALQQQTQSNVRAVVNWQYINALRTWGAVISSYPEPSQLGPLIHPLVQIAMGLMDLFSSPRMFSMHLLIIGILNRVSISAHGVYIPVAPYLMRIITSPSVALSGNASSSSSEPVDLNYTIRVKKNQATSTAYLSSIWTDTLYLLTEHIATHSHTIGFPESFWAVSSTLKKLKSDVKIPQIHSLINNLVRSLEETSQKVSQKRDQASFGPCDLTAVKQLEAELKQGSNSIITLYEKMRRQKIDTFSTKQEKVAKESKANAGGASKKQHQQQQRKRGRADRE